jgi:hypothetical protein
MVLFQRHILIFQIRKKKPHRNYIYQYTSQEYYWNKPLDKYISLIFIKEKDIYDLDFILSVW